jgi:hypothetical protein
MPKLKSMFSEPQTVVPSLLAFFLVLLGVAIFAVVYLYSQNFLLAEPTSIPLGQVLR